MKKIAILTSGGDAPGMNAAIRGILRMAIFLNLEVCGVYQGYQGLLEEEFINMTSFMAGGIIHRGGTILKTARCALFTSDSIQKKAVGILKARHVDSVIVIGGDGSLKGAAALSRQGIPTITIPATIDNDMAGTEETIGFDTAVNTVLYAVRKIRDTAASHNRAAIIEVMGRHSGHIALAAGLSSGAEYILVPEIPYRKDALAHSLLSQMKLKRTNSIIICAEGAAHGPELATWLKEHTNIDVCVTNLGYIQRGGEPSSRDSLLGSLFGAKAVEYLFKQEWVHHMVGVIKNQVVFTPYEEIEGHIKEFNAELYKLASLLADREPIDKI